MVYTHEQYLPTVEELTVPEVRLSTPTLRSASVYLGKYCEFKNNEFMLCREELKDPRKCIKEGKEVTACSLEFFRLMKKNCHNEFVTYNECVFKGSGDYAFGPCRKSQYVLDKCVLEKMNIERPEFGYFCRAKIHDSERPAPPKPKKKLYTDIPPYLPENYPKPEARYGGRHFWSTE